RHAKIVFEAAFCVGSFLMADDADALAAEAAEAADDGRIVAELPVTGESDEIADQPGDVVETVWPLRMPGNLSLLPGCELRVELLQSQRCFRLQPVDFLADRDGISPLAPRPAFLRLGLKFGHRFFEIEITAHWVQVSFVFSGGTDAGQASKSSKRVNFAFMNVFG